MAITIEAKCKFSLDLVLRVLQTSRSELRKYHEEDFRKLDEAKKHLSQYPTDEDAASFYEEMNRRYAKTSELLMQLSDTIHILESVDETLSVTHN